MLKNPVTFAPIFAIQLKRSISKSGSSKPKVYSKHDELMLTLLAAFIETKLALISESIAKTNVSNRLSTFVQMEGALLGEKSYYDFYHACKEWLPKVCVFAYASVVFYSAECDFADMRR